MAQQPSNTMNEIKEKLTLTLLPEIKAAIKIEAIKQGITASDLVLNWAVQELEKSRLQESHSEAASNSSVTSTKHS